MFIRNNWALAGLMLLSSALINCRTNPSKPHGQMIDSVFEAGHVRDSLDHVFYLKSIGDKDLIIETVNSSCECTKVTWPKGPIKKGDTAAIKVRLKPQEAFKGSASAHLVVKTNSKDQMNGLTITYTK